ncbi:hypothetical protein QYE76_051373 [Lolium multiflorum]|uniref:Reverse transcriptase Ty1/copia-type domain-containing protein n=1 Tax=Lolium multiflorum TaxID=4521 RepID=A0AAD8SSP1_LOLMU|nr:hypothetical protein QYE76_051373 [Lolium multiflorum]
MHDEFDALQRNQTWTLVPRPPHANIITGKWVFKHKFHPDGTLDRHKARWVVRGFRQRAGVDFTDTFAPVVKPGMIRTVLQVAVSRAWPVHQMDVSNAFLHGHLEERSAAAHWLSAPKNPPPLNVFSSFVSRLSSAFLLRNGTVAPTRSTSVDGDRLDRKTTSSSSSGGASEEATSIP